MINIMIVDDHAVVRQGLRQIISQQPDMQVGGEAADAQELMDLLPKQKWDIVVLDMTMAGRSGLDALRDVKMNYPKLPVLVLSMHPEDQFATRVLKAGASGYITKGSAPDELMLAIRRVISGDRYISAAMAEKLVEGIQKGGGRPLHESLSGREYQVMQMIASGKGLTEIGKELSLSVKTIGTYRERILEKMGLKSNAELTRYAIKHELVE